MADNKTDEEIIREVGLEEDNKSEELLEELIADDLTNDESIVFNEQNNRVHTDKINSEDDDDSNILENSEEELPVQKKQSKIFKILVGVIAFLLVLLTIGIILYLTGYFDPEEEKKPIAKIEKKMTKKDDEIAFSNAQIDKNRLNKKLNMLTKHEIMEKEELEAAKKKKEEAKKAKELEIEKKKEYQEQLKIENKRIEEEKQKLKDERIALKAQQESFLKMQEEQKRLLEEQKLEIIEKIKEQENIKAEEQVEETVEEENKMKEEEIVEETSTPNLFLSFINVATIKGELYKSFLDKAQSIESDISLCRDNKNRIEVYFGPYDSMKERNKVFNNLIDDGFKEAYLIDFTQEEYDKRCKY